MAKIFVIDDDPELLMMVGMILRRAGHETTLASDSVEGSDRVIVETPDLLILDLMMPHMSGFDVCRKIRASTASDTPIMILTARIQEADREAAFEAGASDYMTKPITSRQLTSRVERLLEQSHQREDAETVLDQAHSSEKTESSAELSPIGG